MIPDDQISLSPPSPNKKGKDHFAVHWELDYLAWKLHYSFLPEGNKDERSADRSIATPGGALLSPPPHLPSSSPSHNLPHNKVGP